jgi:DNA topoisomerase-1
MFVQANAKVAYICNHQKKIPKGFEERIRKIDDRIKELEKGNNAKASVQIAKLQRKKQLQLALKNLSVSTSKMNYLDPRITVAFMKRHELPIDKFFSKALMEKFEWAFTVEKTWRF